MGRLTGTLMYRRFLTRMLQSQAKYEINSIMDNALGWAICIFG
jgi:hypothetical protein